MEDHIKPKYEKPSVDNFGVVTKYSADSIEFCPHIGHHQDSGVSENFFVCGNYYLIEGNEQEKRRKVGKLYLYEIGESDDDVTFHENQAIETSAILDLKWSFSLVNDKALLGQVTVDGTLDVFAFEGSKDPKSKFSLSELASVQIGDDILCLSLDWNNRLVKSNTPSIVVSLGNSENSLAICELNESGLNVTRMWKGHEYETWIAAFDYHQTNVIYSGADDCKLKGWDLREDLSRATFTKSYSMGVTTIQSCPHRENLFAVGSYDDTLTIWDNRSMKSSVCSVNTGGGVWRVKWHPTDINKIATASMRAGFKVISVPLDNNGNSATEIASYRPSCEPIAYGIDWCYNKKKSNLLATCSFYDHFCSMWKI